MGTSRAAAIGIAVLVLAVSVSGQDRPLPAVDPFLKEVRARLETDSSRQSGYSYVEKRQRSSIDGKGRRHDQSVTVLESYPGLPGEDDRWPNGSRGASARRALPTKAGSSAIRPPTGASARGW